VVLLVQDCSQARHQFLLCLNKPFVPVGPSTRPFLLAPGRGRGACGGFSRITRAWLLRLMPACNSVRWRVGACTTDAFPNVSLVVCCSVHSCSPGSRCCRVGKQVQVCVCVCECECILVQDADLAGVTAVAGNGPNSPSGFASGRLHFSYNCTFQERAFYHRLIHIVMYGLVPGGVL